MKGKNANNASTDPNKKTVSKSPKWISLKTAVMMTAGVLTTNLNHAQTQNNIVNPNHIQTQNNITNPNHQKENTIELVQWNIDSLDHEKIINTNVDSLLTEYGEEKWMEIIRTHMLIEINKVRQEFNSVLIKDSAERRLWSLSLNAKLSDAAQKYAQYLYENNRYDHTWKDWSTFESRIKATWYPFNFFWENIFHPKLFAPTIKNAIMAWKWSTGHCRTINGKHYLHVGIWYYKWYRVTDFWGPRGL